MVNNISEELHPHTKKTDMRKFFCHAGNNLWFYKVLQLRRNHTACLCRNLHFHKGIILNQLKIKFYAQSPYLLEVTTPSPNKQLMKQLQTGCAVAQEASWEPLTTEAWMQSQVTPYGKCGPWNDTRTCFFPSTSVFPCQLNFNIVPYSNVYPIALWSTSCSHHQTVVVSVLVHKAVLFKLCFLHTTSTRQTMYVYH